MGQMIKIPAIIATAKNDRPINAPKFRSSKLQIAPIADAIKIPTIISSVIAQGSHGRIKINSPTRAHAPRTIINRRIFIYKPPWM